MPATGGRRLLTAFEDQVINVGHSQDLIFILTSNHGVEDTLEAVGGMLGVGIYVRTNGVPGSTETNSAGGTDNSTHSHLFWSGNEATAGYLADLVTWARGGPEGALYGYQLSDPTFTLRYSSSGGFQNAAGIPLYWLAITGVGEDEDMPTANGNFNAAIPSITTTFPPTAAIALGIGTNTVGTGSFAQLPTWATPTWGVWTYDFEEEGTIINGGMHLAYAMSHEAFNNLKSAEWSFSRQFVYDNQLVLSTFATSAFGYSRDDTHFYNNYHYPGGAWVGNYGRVGVAVMGGIVAVTEDVLPASGVGGTVDVETPFDPVAVIFMCDSDGNMPHGGNDWSMGAAVGFAARENGFQAVVACGGQHEISMSRYQSPNRAWVSNFTGASGSGIHAGTATFPDGLSGFRLTTTDAGRSARTIMYTAFGFPAPQAPGFFRVVRR
jgi:hypothetical protein